MYLPLDWHLTKGDILLYYSKDRLDALVKKYAIDRTRTTILPPNFSASFDAKDGAKTVAAAIPFIGKREKLIESFCLTLGRKCRRMVSYFLSRHSGMTDLL